MRRWHALAAAALLGCAACGEGVLPRPTLRSVTPAEAPAGQETRVRVRFEAVLPFELDYGGRTLEVARSFSLQVGPALARVQGVEGSDTLVADVPATLPGGAHDVRLQLADGREGSLPGAFTVTPALRLTGFGVERVEASDPVLGTPFRVRLQALGRGGEAPHFTGRVQLGCIGCVVQPAQSEPFVAGTLEQLVTVVEVLAAGQPVTLVATDAAGRGGASTAFRVTPGP